MPERKLPHDYHNDFHAKKILLDNKDKFDSLSKEVSPPITSMGSTVRKQISRYKDDSTSGQCHTSSLLEHPPNVLHGTLVSDPGSEDILLVCQNNSENWKNQDIEYVEMDQIILC